MERIRVLFATMEIDPFLKISNAADFIRKLPLGLQEKGYEIRILMPKFGVISDRKNRLHEVVRLSGINIRVGNEEKPLTIKVATIPNARLQVYFLDNEDYFQRKSVLTDPKNEDFHADNDERSIFFCKGVIETVKKLGWTPHIIHCHGWMTALIPLYLKTHFKEDPVFRNAKVVYTAYDNEIDQQLPSNFADKAKLEGTPLDLLHQYSGTHFGDISTAGMRMADAVTTGIPEMPLYLQNSIQNHNIEVRFNHDQGMDAAQTVESYNALYQTILN